MEQIFSLIYRTRLRWVALIRLDIRNAFNSASWKHIINRLDELNISTYLVNTIQSYLEDRYIRTRKCPQSQSWVFFDGILRLDMVGYAHSIAFADDMALLIAADDQENLVHYVNLNTMLISRWLTTHNLQLAVNRAAADILRGKCNWKDLTFKIQKDVSKPSKHIRYLGVIYSNGGFGQHIIQDCNKADEKIAILGRILPNVAGPSFEKRLATLNVTHQYSFMLPRSGVIVHDLRCTEKNWKTANGRRCCLWHQPITLRLQLLFKSSRASFQYTYKRKLRSGHFKWSNEWTSDT